LIGWVAAGRAIRPVRRVTAAAEDVARTQDLSEPLPVEGTDEVARLATSFNTMMAALRRSKDQQKRLVMDASHELRTPLTSLRTSIEVLERGIPDHDVRTRLLANASSELRELTTLVAELVDLATDHSPETAPRSEVDLVVAAERAADRGRQRHGRIIEIVADGSNVVDAAGDGVDRALNNLVDNAAKFSPPDTPIEIRVRGTSVEVRDRGPGIAEADIAHVFDRFYRAETARTLTGSGLGLAIVAQVAADHDGETIARNDPHGGAVVGFSLGRGAKL
jgi:two-component system sensor histidine kinase MprB